MSQGARFVWNTRYFHIAKPGEQESEYALTKEHAKKLIDYMATRESVVLNMENEANNVPSTYKQKDALEKLTDIFESEGTKYDTYPEYTNYKTSPTRGNASELITCLSEEIMSNNAFDENARAVAKESMNIVDYYDTSKRSATAKQKELIEQLVKALVPKEEKRAKFLDEILEYDDYINAPTVSNASELISYLSEQLKIHGAFDEAANLIEYTAKRPGAVRVGEHGLFSSEDNVDLEKAKEEVSNHQGNIWTHILSLRREDADKLGYDSQEPWKNLIKTNLDVLAKAQQIDINNLRWYAAMHNTGHHPHIHLTVFSSDPKEGFFSEKANGSISKCKSKFANIIFADEMHNEFVQKNEYREELKIKSKEALSTLLENPSGQYTEEVHKRLVNQMVELADKLPDKKEIKYGYLSQNNKMLVNEILRSLVYDSPVLSQLYTSWCNHQFNIERMYINSPKEMPIEKNDEFRPIQNEIIKQASNIKNHASYSKANENSIISTQQEMTNNIYGKKTAVDNLSVKNSTATHNTNNKNYSAQYSSPVQRQSKNSTAFYIKEYPYPILYSPEPDNPTLKNIFTNLIFKSDAPDIQNFKALNNLANDFNTRTGEICCKLADCYNYGIGTEKSFDNALMWYGIAADQFQDGMASYRLGQIYMYGTDDTEIDTELGNHYFKQAFDAFKIEIENGGFFDDLDNGEENLQYYSKVSKSDAYKEYLMGRMYLKGEGVEQNYYKSLQTFDLAAKNGYVHANYYIGNQYYYGLGVERDIEEAVKCFDKSTLNGNASAPYILYKLYSEGTEIKQDVEKANVYLNVAAELDNPYAQYTLGKAEVERGNIDEGIYWLKKSADKDISHSNYQLGIMYSSEQYHFNDENTSQAYFKKALYLYLEDYNNNSDDFTAYRIGQMYLYGQGTEVDIKKAVEWFEKSAQLDNPDAYYQLGYLYKKYGMCKKAVTQTYFSKALDLYTKSFAKNPNGSNAYNIGIMYQYGLGVERDIEEAVKWYKKSLEFGNCKAQEKIETVEQQHQLSAMSIATTACHLGRIINTETMQSFNKRYASDSKILQKEKVNKIYAGHAADEKEQSYDY
ncbi:MAG: MobP3 family relaxase [Ruminococcus sp.]